MSLDEIVNALLTVKGITAAAIVDYSSGMMMASGSHDPDFDLEMAAAGNVNVVRAQVIAMKMLDSADIIHDILVSLPGQYHLICPCTKKEGIFIYLVADRRSANLSTCRRSMFHAESLIV